MTNEWSKEVFSKNLQMYMERSGKTQKELAEIMGVTAPTFHEWVKGKKFPRIDKVQKLADYFGILKSDLIEEKTEERREMQKSNDTLANIIVRLRTDKAFLTAVEALYELDAEKLSSVSTLLK
ncbi:MAG: helix-turn-helix transcriptional regulator [Oscillospiraceae bacterium]|nr:helix-turn-helix transcriptional regulator [Oscillospiraceae bacterium]